MSIISDLPFSLAIEKLTEGERISRAEWNDKRTYGLLKENLLQLHKAGEDEETTHPWILNDGDLLAKDWFLV